MSRQPPLPPGPPPNSMDSYRPGAGRSDRDARRDPPMYHFGGNRSSSNLRSPPRYNYGSDYDRNNRNDRNYSSYRPPHGNNYAPGTGPAYDDRRTNHYDKYSPSNGGYDRRPDRDQYRPAEGGFTFRTEAPPGVDFNLTRSQRPRSPRNQHNEPANSYRGNNYSDRRPGQNGQRGGHGYRGRGGPRLASEREFLKGNREPTPELMPGMEEGEKNGVRYKPIEDLSDSEEADMDMSEDDEDEADGQPKKKQARADNKPSDGNSVPQFAKIPKWSNPDPYTVLPPTDDSSRKSKDVVKLIRKARVESSTSASKTSGEADAGDFISFDFGDGDETEEETDSNLKSQGVGVVGAPTGPRTLNYPHALTLTPEGNVSKKRSAPVDLADVVDLTSGTPPQRREQPIHNLPSKPVTSNPSTSGRQPITHNLPTKPPASRISNTIDLTTDSSLGSRKRNIRDEIKETPTLREALSRGPQIDSQPGVSKSLKGVPPPAHGRILAAWAPVRNQDPTPWATVDHTDTANMGLWLHKEIIDFYEFVKPQVFEDFIRLKLVEDLRNRIRQSNQYRDADVLPFGSFPAGLYLPTADMDVVVVSDQFMRSGRKIIGQSPSQVRKFGMWIEKEGLAVHGSLDMVLRARVPLVKYVDRVTGLKVDISFENDTGLTANKTFQEWKTTYPAMPILVTLIKHMLAMRGLNEPVNGGIGGFSITCLVVSLLQLMPQIQSRTMVAEHHLGEVLMEFLDLYGNEFNVNTTAIQFDPPGYVSKAQALQVYRNSDAKFCIIDPNNPSNDISGGSKNTTTIRCCFSEAFDDLRKRMSSLQYSSNRQNQSILGTILGGNYESFRLQRKHLAHIHEKLFGPIER